MAVGSGHWTDRRPSTCGGARRPDGSWEMALEERSNVPSLVRHRVGAEREMRVERVRGVMSYWYIRRRAPGAGVGADKAGALLRNENTLSCL